MVKTDDSLRIFCPLIASIFPFLSSNKFWCCHHHCRELYNYFQLGCIIVDSSKYKREKMILSKYSQKVKKYPHSNRDTKTWRCHVLPIKVWVRIAKLPVQPSPDSKTMMHCCYGSIIASNGIFCTGVHVDYFWWNASEVIPILFRYVLFITYPWTFVHVTKYPIGCNALWEVHSIVLMHNVRKKNIPYLGLFSLKLNCSR